MKKLISIFLIGIMMFSLPVTVFATGTPNIDGGGGGMGSGTSSNRWTPGRDGVRVTIIRVSDNQPVSTPIDFTNNPPTDIRVHFGKVSKLSYKNGTGITTRTGTYVCTKPAKSMPRIVSSSGGNNINAIKDYFCRKGTLQDIANATGFNYNVLINGEYKIMLEPMAYFKYENVMYAMTATEAALFDRKVNGNLRSKMVSLSHKNLPLSMFLENDELGFTAWHGSTASPQSNENIIAYLGVGIVRFTEIEVVPLESEIQYRTDTDVIISVTLSTATEKTPENPAYATFSINGSTYTHSNIYIPEGSSQLAWIKWRTPPTAGTVTISIFSNCSLDKNIITAEIVDMNKKTPPNPQADDRDDDYITPSPPNKANVTTLTWGEWDCWWEEDWVWIPVWYWCEHAAWVSNGTGGGYWNIWGHWLNVKKLIC